jgi:hypothetical protein
LRDLPTGNVRVFVVWEPVLVTDVEPPSNRELQRVSDTRAQQFWDKGAAVSRAVSPPIVAPGQDVKRQRYRTSGDRLWDTIAVYPAGAAWEDKPPVPIYTGGPVVNVASDLRKTLRDAIDHPMLVE